MQKIHRAIQNCAIVKPHCLNTRYSRTPCTVLDVKQINLTPGLDVKQKPDELTHLTEKMVHIWSSVGALSVLWYDYFSTLFFQRSRESFSRTIHVPKLVIRSFRLIFGDHPLLEIQRCPFEKKICRSPLFLPTAFRTMTKSQFIILYHMVMDSSEMEFKIYSISGKKKLPC